MMHHSACRAAFIGTNSGRISRNAERFHKAFFGTK